MNFKFFIGQLPHYDRHNTVWKTATGRHMSVFWMTTNHIINTLGCLREIGLTEIPDVYLDKTKQEWIEIFKTELRVREQENQQRV
jgi:saccharopine dehydrogenase-like NADP-dependent oxidoreductase